MLAERIDRSAGVPGSGGAELTQVIDQSRGLYTLAQIERPAG